jgi:MFS transporter, DHA1 family, inner membrane transport protein
VLAWALLGQPAAWVLGMPLISLLAQSGWRLAWLAIPLPAAVLALGGARALAGRSDDTGARPAPIRGTALCRRPQIAGWGAGELLAFTAWSGTLVYAGALLTESYGRSASAAALVLALSAADYFPGTLSARSLVERHARRLLIGLGLTAAGGVALLASLRVDLAVSTVAANLTALMAVVGVRTLTGSAFGLDAAPNARVDRSRFCKSRAKQHSATGAQDLRWRAKRGRCSPRA